VFTGATVVQLLHELGKGCATEEWDSTHGTGGNFLYAPETSRPSVGTNQTLVK